jgi:hypothetical protein
MVHCGNLKEAEPAVRKPFELGQVAMDSRAEELAAELPNKTEK